MNTGETTTLAALVVQLRQALEQATECCARPPGVCFDPALAGSPVGPPPATQDPGGDPDEVQPSDSRAESQAALNGPSGSPTSPPGRVLDIEWAERIIAGPPYDRPVGPPPAPPADPASTAFGCAPDGKTEA